jgi:muramoyltetrapeptide carboxypeptidase
MIRPASLQKGDTVGIVGLACKVEIAQILPAVDILEQWGLKVIIGQSVYSAYYQFAGDDKIRRDDFQLMLDNQDIKAIFSARGGYGSSRILDQLDYTLFAQCPKWIVGFSDITAVHGQLHGLGFESLHATMPKLFNQTGGAFSLESLQKCLFGEILSYQITPHFFNIFGQGKGALIGGNLCLIAHLLGSDDEIDTNGKILFLEDISEYLYAIDRLMVQLKRAKKLDKLAGLIVGHFSETQDNAVPFGKTPYEIIQEHVQDFNYPVCYGFSVGHEPDNWAMPCGRNLTLIVEENRVLLLEDNQGI